MRPAPRSGRARPAPAPAPAPRTALADLAALGLLAAATAAFFAPVLFGPWHLPAGGGDLASFLFPMYRFIAERFVAGDLPLWNPHQYAGAPLAADNQAGLYYPPLATLFLLWPRFPYAALEGMAMLHVWGAGAAMYLALRLWRPIAPIARAAALVGALAYMFGDVLVTHLGNLNFDAAAAWAPLAVATLSRAIDAPDAPRRRRRAVGAGALVGVAALAGHAQVTFLTLGALAALALWRLAADRAPGALEALALAGLAAAGLAAVVVLPALELRALSARADMGYAATLEYALPPAGLLGLLAPGFFGRGPGGFWAGWPRVETGYVGVLTLALAAAAVVAAAWPAREGDRPPRLGRDVAFWLLLGLGAVGLALGPATPLHRLLLAPLGLPFRAPARFLLLADLALAALAALGLDALLRPRAPVRAAAAAAAAALGAALLGLLWTWGDPARLAAVASVPPARVDAALHAAAGRSLAVAAALAAAGLGLLAAHALGRLRPNQLGALAVALLAADLVGLGARVEIDRADPVDGFERTVAADWLRREAGLARIDDASGRWQPGAAQVHGLYAIGGVHNPLRLAVYATVMDALEARGSNLFNLLGVRYVLTDKGAAPSDRDFIVPAFDGDPAVDVWRNERAAPRLLVVGGTRIVPDDAAALAAIRAEDWDPAAAVVLTAEEAARVGARAEAGGPDARRGGQDDPASAVGTGMIRRYGTDDVTLLVHLYRPAWALLTDIHHPSWRATVGPEPAAVARADFALRAVRVPAGCHLVRLRFRPVSWPLGAGLSLATVLALVALATPTLMPRGARRDARAA